MPRKAKAQLAALPATPAELLEQFGNGPMTAQAINAATLALKKERPPRVGKPLYAAPGAEVAQAELDAFADGPWGQNFRASAARDSVLCGFRRARKIIYTTNAIENINSQLRKIIKTRGPFQSDEAATKLIGRPCATSPRIGEVPRMTGRRP